MSDPITLPKLNPIEQEIVNVVSILADTLGTLAAAKNPAYASLIQTGQGFVDAANAAVNPSQAAQAVQLSSDAAAAVQPVTNQVKTIASGAAPAAAKAAAVSGLLSVIAKVGSDIWGFFHPSAQPVPPTS